MNANKFKSMVIRVYGPHIYIVLYKINTCVLTIRGQQDSCIWNNKSTLYADSHSDRYGLGLKHKQDYFAILLYIIILWSSSLPLVMYLCANSATISFNIYESIFLPIKYNKNQSPIVDFLTIIYK